MYLHELMRLQLMVATAGLIAFAGVIGALPLALLTLPGLIKSSIFGIPVWLVLLGPPPFLLFIGIGIVYRRRADLLDAEFAELVHSR